MTDVTRHLTAIPLCARAVVLRCIVNRGFYVPKIKGRKSKESSIELAVASLTHSLPTLVDFRASTGGRPRSYVFHGLIGCLVSSVEGQEDRVLLLVFCLKF